MRQHRGNGADEAVEAVDTAAHPLTLLLTLDPTTLAECLSDF
jgi:hypothetical protein